jgi:hypothetical protein
MLVKFVGVKNTTDLSAVKIQVIYTAKIKSRNMRFLL